MLGANRKKLEKSSKIYEKPQKIRALRKIFGLPQKIRIRK